MVPTYTTNLTCKRYSGFQLYNASNLYFVPGPRDNLSVEKEIEFEFASLYYRLDNFDMVAIAHQPHEFVRDCTLVQQVSKQCQKLMTDGGNQVNVKGV